MGIANDLDLYEREAHQWWDACSHPFRSLHAVNEYRKGILTEWFGNWHPGRSVIDLGCGGGLLSKFFVDGGARVAGLDVSRASVRVAKGRLAAGFAQGDVQRAPFADGCADIVLLSDVLEHVARPAVALSECARILRPGGMCFVSTLNRTLRARMLGVWLAEGIGLVPRGTHDADMFVKPAELYGWGSDCGLALEELRGESIDIARTIRRWTVSVRRGNDCSITYSALLRKR
ncbi:MAG: bifunctional 2-polyprenyl-6-hydroxyphenol methylase/3-demethylubiquinol 3-O-methyltransferase UbiG [Planctomycetota bacterium]|nr:bifunctional 2-polyprenyl-6-hydroxyphenol methylase/3-demethylubiquinol 3-O-methyltransferase UbiG [Planctomycetota bacterium]